MLQDWAVGFDRNCALLLNTAPRFSARVGWIGLFDIIPRLFARAPVSHVLDSCILRLDEGWKDY